MSANDIVIVTLADEVAELRERLAVAESFREMAKAAIEKLADQHTEIEYQRRRIASLIDENRDLRGAAAA